MIPIVDSTVSSQLPPYGISNVALFNQVTWVKERTGCIVCKFDVSHYHIEVVRRL